MTTRTEAIANALRWAEAAEEQVLLQKDASDLADTAREEKENWLSAGVAADKHGKRKDGACQMAMMWAAVAQAMGPGAGGREEGLPE
ncbi:hypothetical protein [Amycolatopsis rubida]|uniref:Uncharacterized protein n=1 Tax=Amycolatopsis rubida TaxID=112413 RepID=A0A1I5X3I1_9PSEU|nr:hypothetical protein [Amycolatopsis rubida]SFQ26498.1 hypothetical protein SAMN05421854_11014 [Amycolatopsis rubida]